MFDPFSAWSQMASVWLDAAQTGVTASRMVEASNRIASTRTGMIGTAMRNPLEGDYVELGRMVPEKLEAFGKAASALGDEFVSMQAAFIAEAEHAAAMALRGRPPTLDEWDTQTTRSAAYATRSVERISGLAALALAPIDATVTANARRLKRAPVA